MKLTKKQKILNLFDLVIAQKKNYKEITIERLIKNMDLITIYFKDNKIYNTFIEDIEKETYSKLYSISVKHKSICLSFAKEVENGRRRSN